MPARPAIRFIRASNRSFTGRWSRRSAPMAHTRSTTIGWPRLHGDKEGFVWNKNIWLRLTSDQVMSNPPSIRRQARSWDRPNATPTPTNPGPAWPSTTRKAILQDVLDSLRELVQNTAVRAGRCRRDCAGWHLQRHDGHRRAGRTDHALHHHARYAFCPLSQPRAGRASRSDPLADRLRPTHHRPQNTVDSRCVPRHLPPLGQVRDHRRLCAGAVDRTRDRGPVHGSHLSVGHRPERHAALLLVPGFVRAHGHSRWTNCRAS